MTSRNYWYDILATESHLSSNDADQLRDAGFVVLPGPVTSVGCEQLSAAYDREVSAAGSTDIHHGKSGTNIRINDFVNRGPEFDGIYIYPPLLAACCQVIGMPFKLSGMRARTLKPGATMEALHVDVKHRANGWPALGCILMVDAFTVVNGATRFVPGSHLQTREPQEVVSNPLDAHEQQIFACGSPGSIIIFNASVWHSHGANRTTKPRRSIQAHFIPREAESSRDDHAEGMRPETLQRISDRAKYILNVPDMQ